MTGCGKRLGDGSVWRCALPIEAHYRRPIPYLGLEGHLSEDGVRAIEAAMLTLVWWFR